METSKISYIKFWSCLITKYFSFVSQDVSNFISCQFALESNFGNSILASSYFNHCGMKLPRTRLSTACNLGLPDDFAHYSSSIHCVFDYFLLFEFNKIRQNMFFSLKSFKLALTQIGYCPEKDYVSRIENIYNQFINS